jgi:hypothetical protein
MPLKILCKSKILKDKSNFLLIYFNLSFDTYRMQRIAVFKSLKYFAFLNEYNSTTLKQSLPKE